MNECKANEESWKKEKLGTACKSTSSPVAWCPFQGGRDRKVGKRRRPVEMSRRLMEDGYRARNELKQCESSPDMALGPDR